MKKTSLTWINLNQSSFNPRNKDAAIEIYISSLEEKLMKIEIPTDKYNNLTRKERQALYDLKNDKKYCY